MKSKANLARRQKSIEERLDPKWQPERAEPVLEGGTVRYEVSGRVEGIGCGGLGMLQTVIEAAGLREAIDERLHLLKRHLPYHESDHVLSQALIPLTGGQCLEDLELRRRDEAFLDALGARRIPDPTTAGDFLRWFDAESVLALQEAINEARSSVWRAQPPHALVLGLVRHEIGLRCTSMVGFRPRVCTSKLWQRPVAALATQQRSECDAEPAVLPRTARERRSIAGIRADVRVCPEGVGHRGCRE